MPRKTTPTRTTRPRPITASAPATTAAEVREIDVHDIATDGSNPRTLFDLDGDAGLAELAASIEAQGLLQPIIVRPAAEGETGYLLVAGERRLRAVRDILTWPTITALVRAGMDARAALEATVLENLQRRDLHPVEEARGLAALRGRYGYTPDALATRLGRSTEWVKNRLTLATLPPEVQDLALRSQTGHLTLGALLKLADYTHGGPDNKGFPALITTLARSVESGENPTAGLEALAYRHEEVITTIQHAYSGGDGRWGGNFFDTKDVCRRCPFAAYRAGYYDGIGHCLLPRHYEELQAKGKAAYEVAHAHENAAARTAATTAVVSGYHAPLQKTAAQKGQETRQRHKDQRAAYYPTVQAIGRVIDLLPANDPQDIAVACAYILSPSHVLPEAVAQMAKRHGLTSVPPLLATPSDVQIARLRQMEPGQALRCTLEALLLSQALRARDFDPGKTPAEAVLALYLRGHVASPRTATAEEHPVGDQADAGAAGDAAPEDDILDDEGDAALGRPDASPDDETPAEERALAGQGEDA